MQTIVNFTRNKKNPKNVQSAMGVMTLCGAISVGQCQSLSGGFTPETSVFSMKLNFR